MNQVITRDRVLSQKEEPRVFPKTLALRIMALVELLILIGTSLIVYNFYMGLDFASFPLYGYSTLGLSVVTIITFYQMGFYEFGAVSDRSRSIHKIIGVLSLIFLLFLSLLFALKVSDQISRLWVFSWFLSSALLIGLERSLSKQLFDRLAQKGQLSRRIIIIGASAQSEKLLQQIKQKNDPWFNVIGIFDDRKKRIGHYFQGHPVLGTLKDALNFCRQNHVDDIIVSLPWSAELRICGIIEKLKELPVYVRLCPDMAGFLHSNSKYSNLAGVPMLDVVNKPLDGGNYVVKMIEDKILSFLLLVMLSPVMLIIALVIKLDSPGTALFRQKR